MRCPVCQAATMVKDSRPRENGDSWYRRRQCVNGHLSSSVERYFTPAAPQLGGLGTGAIMRAAGELALLKPEDLKLVRAFAVRLAKEQTNDRE